MPTIEAPAPPAAASTELVDEIIPIRVSLPRVDEDHPEETFFGPFRIPGLARMPGTDGPPPAQRKLAAICGWACTLGFGGVFAGLLAFIAIVTRAPWWFEPAIVGVGIVGVALTVGALAAIRHRWLPWLLLPAASLTLLVGLVLTAIAV